MKKIVILLFLGIGHSYAGTVEFKYNHANLREELFHVMWQNHHPIDYQQARQAIFKQLFVQQDRSGRFYVKDIYCHTIKRAFFKRRRKINIEHTWPQSKFNENFSHEVQKADLYHLFPADKLVNSERGNYPFGEVNGAGADNGKCPASRIGLLNSTDYPVRGTQTYFEPPAEIRGDIARGLFYFAVKYQRHISYAQEYFLRKWNHDDPVSPEELLRMEQIKLIQGNINPFIEDASLVEQISDF